MSREKSFYTELSQMFSDYRQAWRYVPLVLGGTSGSGGGSGAAPAGVTGQLSQRFVAGDSDEFRTLTSGSNGSLLDNLNNIRYWETTQIAASAPSPTFAGQLWVDTSSGSLLMVRNEDDTAWMTVSSSGSGGTTTLTDTYVGFGSASNTVTGSANFTFDNTSKILAFTNPSASAGEASGFTTTADSAAAVFKSYSAATGGGARTNITASGGYMLLGTSDANPLTFYTSGTERARFDTNGVLTVGAISSPITTAGSVVSINNGTAAVVGAISYGASRTPTFAGFSSHGAWGSESASLMGDPLVALTGRPYGATQFATGSRGTIRLVCAETTATDSAQGTQWEFTTSGSSNAASTIRGRILENGVLDWLQPIKAESYIDIAAISNPSAPAAGIVRLHALQTQGFSRLEQDNEAATNVTLGRDSVFIVRNTSGSVINVGQPLYVKGSTGNVPDVGLAKATSGSLPVVGVALDSIANNAFGQAMSWGIISSVNTASYSAGDQLWVDATTAGALTKTRPVSPNLVARVGSVLVSGVGNGSVLVQIAPFIGGLESGTTAATWLTSGIVDSRHDGIGTTSTDGIVLDNTTAAAAGAQQYSPRLKMEGRGWHTASGGASETDGYFIESQPVQGTSSAGVDLVFTGYTSLGSREAFRWHFSGEFVMNSQTFTFTNSSILGHLQWTPTTSDKTITLPDATGTVALLESTQSFTGINTFSNTTDSSSVSTGALITSGGAGIAKALFVGTSASVATGVNVGTSTGAAAGQVKAITANSGYLPMVGYAVLGSNITSNAIVCGSAIGYACTLRRMNVDTYVFTTNSASHYWTVSLINLNSGATITSFTTAADSPDAWYNHAVTGLSTALATTDKGVYVNVTKTGSPGGINILGTAVYVE